MTQHPLNARSAAFHKPLNAPPGMVKRIRYWIVVFFYPEFYVGDDCGSLEIEAMRSIAIDKLRRLERKYPEAVAQIIFESQQ